MQVSTWDSRSLFVVRDGSGLPKQMLAAQAGIWRMDREEPYRRRRIDREVRAREPLQ